ARARHHDVAGHRPGRNGCRPGPAQLRAALAPAFHRGILWRPPMSFHSLARSGATSLLVLAACSTAPSRPAVAGEPFTRLVDDAQGGADGALLTAFTDRAGGAWVGGNVALLVHRRPGGSWPAEPIPVEGSVTALWQDDAGRILAAAGTQL